jgi:hypothetical protein
VIVSKWSKVLDIMLPSKHCSSQKCFKPYSLVTLLKPFEFAAVARLRPPSQVASVAPQDGHMTQHMSIFFLVKDGIIMCQVPSVTLPFSFQQMTSICSQILGEIALS